jgi:hypothetical protein
MLYSGLLELVLPLRAAATSFLSAWVELTPRLVLRCLDSGWARLSVAAQALACPGMALQEFTFI